jgi:hypothetical protein
MIANVEGNNYRISKLDAFAQLNIARKLAPISIMIERMMVEENKGKDSTFLVLLMLGQLPDAESEQVMRKCITAVAREEDQGRKYSPLCSPSGQLMYEDISMKALIDLTAHVITSNLGDFFLTALQRLEAVPTPSP